MFIQSITRNIAKVGNTIYRGIIFKEIHCDIALTSQKSLNMTVFTNNCVRNVFFTGDSVFIHFMEWLFRSAKQTHI